MKKATKRISTAKTKKRSTSRSKNEVSLKYPENIILRHLRLVEHSKTGKVIHHQHTSHLLLFLLLMVLGLFLLASDSYVQSYTSSGTVVVGTIVTGPPPETGAVITYPNDQADFDDKIIDVKGTCKKNSFVIVSNNNVMAGSAACTEAGIFSLQIQLSFGKNVLSALNYDNLNQVGPNSPLTVVFLRKDGNEVATIDPSISAQSIQSLPVNPTTISGLNNNFSDCNSYKVGELPVDDIPHITIVCAPRLFLPELPQVLGVLAWGGTPPYAVSIDMGNETNELLSIASPGYKTLKFSYAVPNIYKLSFKLKDTAGKSASIQTSVQVSGEIASATTTPSAGNTSSDGTIFSSLSKSPTPLYLVAVAVTIGFWGGDLFDRKFGSGKIHKRKRKAV